MVMNNIYLCSSVLLVNDIYLWNLVFAFYIVNQFNNGLIVSIQINILKKR